jgi:hypothetical protein
LRVSRSRGGQSDSLYKTGWLLEGQLFDFFDDDDNDGQGHSIILLTSSPLLEIGETSYILGSHHPRALQGLGFVLVLVERGGG